MSKYDLRKMAEEEMYDFWEKYFPELLTIRDMEKKIDFVMEYVERFKQERLKRGSPLSAHSYNLKGGGIDG